MSHQHTSKRTLFIHVGPAKTGTSAVQHFLRGQDSSVVFYPKIGLWADGSHHNLVFNFYGQFSRPEVTRIDVDEALRAIAAEARSGDRDMIISSEILALYDPGPFVRALLHELGASWEARILLVCREHFSRGASLYNQEVKDFAIGEKATPDEFICRQAQALLYQPKIRRLAVAGFPISVMSYHPASDFGARFLAQFGFAAEATGKLEMRNVSLSTKGLIATLAANNVATNAAERAASFAALRRMRKFFAPSRCIFSADTVARISPVFEPDRAYLADRHGIILPPATSVAGEPGAFGIDQSELEDIASAAAALGESGSAIVHYARRFLLAANG